MQWAARMTSRSLRGTLPGLRRGRPAAPPALACRRRETWRRRPDPTAMAGRPNWTRLELAAGDGIDYPTPGVAKRRRGAAGGPAEHPGDRAAVKVENVADKARAGGSPWADRRRGGGRRRGRHGGRVIVAEQVTGGVEALVGMVATPTTGPTVVVGVGGALAEPARPGRGQAGAAERSRRPRPCRFAGRRSCLQLGRARARPAGRGRGGGAADGRPSTPRWAEIDLNPLLGSPKRAVALYCLVVLGGAAEGGANERSGARRGCAVRRPASPSTGRRS